VSERSKLLSVMVLTEDSGSDAYDTVRALVKEMFKLLVPGVYTHRIGFKPLEEQDARRAMHANLWKSDNPLDQPNIRLLIRSIVNELLKPDGFVLYHIDGDRPWSEYETSENVREFRARVESPIREAIRFHLQKQRAPSEEHDERMRRLRRLVPCYSIEAWCYQNTGEARRLCEEEGCGQCHPRLEDWARSRASLDEISKPKEALCIQDKYNARLASSGFPAQPVFEAGASFAHAVCELLACDELTALLTRTYAVPEPRSS
jgi:hypothetical protein